uniref:Ig-like domain-containing protein n=1 Tax=Lates calcarifer TaxID=8187 RepID=A0A4W6DHR4_LATCA
HQESRFISANVGDNVTLKCFYKGDVAAMFYWYKQTLGQKPRLVSSYYKHDKHGTFTEEFKNNTRFSLDTKDDSATYYCISCYAYKFEFGEGATLSVKGSGLNIQLWLCDSQLYSTHWTCDGEHSVYWFKSSEESHPGLIYTHGDRNDQCERKPNTQTHTCIYNLPMESLSHAGTYYCAVASCGHILFGNGTKLDLSLDSRVYFLSGALAFTTILSVLLVFSLYTMNKRNSCQCTEVCCHIQCISFMYQILIFIFIFLNQGYQDADHLHYAALRHHRVNRTRRQKDDTSSQCVYSTIRKICGI